MKEYISENAFWLLAWTILATCSFGITGALVNYYSEKNKLLAEVSRSAINPVAAVCAIKIEDMTDKAFCASALNLNK